MANEQHHPDGWLQDGSLLYRLTDDAHPVNRDEINVAMADGSRSMESCTRRAGELLDCIRAGQAALFAAADASELPKVPDSVLCYVHAYGDSRADDDGRVDVWFANGGMTTMLPGECIYISKQEAAAGAFSD